MFGQTYLAIEIEKFFKNDFIKIINDPISNSTFKTNITETTKTIEKTLYENKINFQNFKISYFIIKHFQISCFCCCF